MVKRKHGSTAEWFELDDLPSEDCDPPGSWKRRQQRATKSPANSESGTNHRALSHEPSDSDSPNAFVRPLQPCKSRDPSTQRSSPRDPIAKVADHDGSLQRYRENKDDGIATATILRTIEDLEGLLNDALHMARIAAGEQADGARASADPHPTHSQKRTRSSKMATSTTSCPPHGNKPPSKAVEPSLRLSPKDSSGVVRDLSLLKQGKSKSHFDKFLQASESPFIQFTQGKLSQAALPVSPEKEERDSKSVKGTQQAASISMKNKGPRQPRVASTSHKDTQERSSCAPMVKTELPTRRIVRDHIKAYKAPPVLPRTTSRRPRIAIRRSKLHARKSEAKIASAIEVDEQDWENAKSEENIHKDPLKPGHEEHFSQLFGFPCPSPSPEAKNDMELGIQKRRVDLRGCRHVDVHQVNEFDVYDNYSHHPVARDWPNSRKRFAATVACINTAVLGTIIGIYAGEVPAIQYVIVDFHHYAILGNVFLYIGLAIPTLLLWPLPLLHGRKPYTVMALSIALCLQIPQGVAVGAFRSPYVGTYRRILLISRAMSGFAFGFANINLQAALLDVFGASLQSGNPHNVALNKFDARRHGGGIGVWLGIFSWCSIGSISVGFFIGALIISKSDVTWGFWTSLMLLLFVLLLNIMAPELRRSAFRRTVAEIKDQAGDFSRVAKGEVKMHVKGTGPYWWGEEVKAGVELSYSMLKQPGFAILSLYTSWAYAHYLVILVVRTVPETDWAS